MNEQPTQTQVHYRRHLRNYLLDRRLQLRYTLVIVLTSAALTTGLGYFWYKEMREASRLIEVRSLGTLSMAQAQRLEKNLAAEDHKRALVLVGFGLVLVLVLTGYGIMFTHKIAGPLYKVQRHMRAIRNGRLEPVYELRKGDQLRAFFVQFRQMHEALRERTLDEIDVLERVLGHLEECSEPAADLDGPLAELRAILQSKRDSLSPAE